MFLPSIVIPPSSTASTSQSTFTSGMGRVRFRTDECNRESLKPTNGMLSLHSARHRCNVPCEPKPQADPDRRRASHGNPTPTIPARATSTPPREVTIPQLPTSLHFPSTEVRFTPRSLPGCPSNTRPFPSSAFIKTVVSEKASYSTASLQTHISLSPQVLLIHLQQGWYLAKYHVSSGSIRTQRARLCGNLCRA